MLRGFVRRKPPGGRELASDASDWQETCFVCAEQGERGPSMQQATETSISPVDEILPAQKLVAFGLQHVLVMAASPITAVFLISKALNFPRRSHHQSDQRDVPRLRRRHVAAKFWPLGRGRAAAFHHGSRRRADRHFPDHRATDKPGDRHRRGSDDSRVLPADSSGFRPLPAILPAARDRRHAAARLHQPRQSLRRHHHRRAKRREFRRADQCRACVDDHCLHAGFRPHLVRRHASVGGAVRTRRGALASLRRSGR